MNFKRKTKRKDLNQARKVSCMFRFIDDLAVINDCAEGEKVYHETYPPELELTRENRSDTKAFFLDLDIKFLDKKHSLSLYDKRESFPFSIVRMQYLRSNSL